MAKEYSWEIRESAEELYIINGLTYEQVADHTGVSLSQLKRWGKESEWRDRRKMYRQAQTSIRYDVRMAKAKIIKSVIATEDAQKAFAFNSLVSASAAIEKEATEQPKIQAGATRIIKTTQDAIDALQEAIQFKINTMLTQPEALTYEASKDLKQTMEMIEQLAAKYQDKDKGAQNKGLTADTVATIRKQILGISS